MAYTKCEPEASPRPTTAATRLDILSPDSPHTDLIKQVFASSGPKSRPLRIDVNGRKDRRAVCVVYGDGMRYEVLDLDGELVDEEEEEEEEESDVDIA